MYVLSPLSFIFFYKIFIFKKENLFTFTFNFPLLFTKKKLFTFSELWNPFCGKRKSSFFSSQNLKPSSASIATSSRSVFNPDIAEIGMEHHFDLNVLKESGVDVSWYIKAAGWEGYFSELTPVYPDLDREFWKTPVITASEVKGTMLNTKVVVSEATIATTINCPQTGLTQEDKWEEDLGGQEFTFDILMRANTIRQPKWILSRMKDDARVLHQILNMAILHKVSSKDNISMSHKFYLCHLLTEAPINLPNLLLTNFRMYVVHRENSTTIPYGVLLSRVFISQHI